MALKLRGKPITPNRNVLKGKVLPPNLKTLQRKVIPIKYDLSFGVLIKI